MQYTGKIDLFEKAWELALDQYQSSPKLKALIQAMVRNGQPFEDAAERLAKWADLNSAEGGWLDILGIIRNLSRNPGESDDDYRARLKEKMRVDNAGTPDNIIANAADISGDPNPQYMDEMPATFFVYTPDGLQIPRRRLQKLAPAGVLALPGAWLKTVDGGIGITTVTKYSGLEIDGNGHGKRILAAAIDVESMGLVAETGELILTENGERIMTEGV